MAKFFLVLGIILIVLGGGCTLIMVFAFDVGGEILGIAPLIIGLVLFFSARKRMADKDKNEEG